jgi:hypothetical protein
MEKERVEADQAEIEKYFDILSKLLPGSPAGMVINLDEAGHQAWCDAHDEKVIVPAEYEKDTIPIPVKRSEKRAT